MELLSKYLWVFFVSMLPIVELRGAIPIGLALGLPTLPTFITAIIGNSIVVPFLILFSKQVLLWLSQLDHIGSLNLERVGPFFQKIIDRASEKAKNIGNYELLGLFIFVAVPLPGTGAWTGSLIAAILQLPVHKSFPTIFLGVMTAGVIMSLTTNGIFSALSFLF